MAECLYQWYLSLLDHIFRLLKQFFFYLLEDIRGTEVNFSLCLTKSVQNTYTSFPQSFSQVCLNKRSLSFLTPALNHNTHNRNTASGVNIQIDMFVELPLLICGI